MSKRHPSLIDRWMPLYAKDYLLDTGHLSAEEHGAYLLLLMRAWLNDGVLPTDENILRKWSCMEPKQWKEKRMTILAFFVQAADGWHSPRLDLELDIAKGIIAKRAEAGRASGEARKIRREQMATYDEQVFPVCSTHDEQTANKQRTNDEPERRTKPEQTTNPLPIQDIPTYLPTARAREGAFSMTPEWEPSAPFWTLAKRSGHTQEKSGYADALTDFIAYWLTNLGDQRTQSQWEKTFLESWKRFDSHKSALQDCGRKRTGALSPHNDFDKRDYSAGINPDGSF